MVITVAVNSVADSTQPLTRPSPQTLTQSYIHSPCYFDLRERHSLLVAPEAAQAEVILT